MAPPTCFAPFFRHERLGLSQLQRAMVRSRKHLQLVSTPWKINGWNLKIEKENHLPNVYFLGSMLIFQGVFCFYSSILCLEQPDSPGTCTHKYPKISIKPRKNPAQTTKQPLLTPVKLSGSPAQGLHQLRWPGSERLGLHHLPPENKPLFLSWKWGSCPENKEEIPIPIPWKLSDVSTGFFRTQTDPELP